MSPDATTLLPPVVVEPATRPTARRRQRRFLLAAVAVVLLVVGLVARATGDDEKADIRDGTTAVTAEGLAARYGIDVSLIAVTAAGGLVELRFQVVDPDKAAGFLGDPSQLPALIVEESGATLKMASPPHNHTTRLELGETHFFLLANARGAVHAGSLVTLVVGDVRLEHIRALG